MGVADPGHGHDRKMVPAGRGPVLGMTGEDLGSAIAKVSEEGAPGRLGEVDRALDPEGEAGRLRSTTISSQVGTIGSSRGWP